MSQEPQGGGPTEQKSAPKIRPTSFWTRGAPVIDALATLRAIRNLRKGKLRLREAIELAIEQANAFERWRKSGTPIRRIQVWVEGVLVITVTPEQLSVNFKSFNFEVPSPQDAVLQLVKADDGEEEVVLLTLPLSSVPNKGLDETTELPNGQRIRLRITPEPLSQSDVVHYDVLVAFEPEKSVCAVPTSIRATTVVKATEVRGLPTRPMPFMPWAPEQRLTVGAGTCAFALFCVAFAAFVLMLHSDSVGAWAANLGQATSSAILGSDSQEGVHGNQFAGISGFCEQTKTPDAKPNGKAKPDGKRNGKRKPESQNRGAQTVDAGRAASCSPTDNKSAWSAGKTDKPAPAGGDSSAQTAQLASIRQVRVVVDTAAGDSSQLDILRKSFVRVLEQKSKMRVLDQRNHPTFDAVLKLRFEPDETCLGVVLLEIRDTKSRLLWRDRADCRLLKSRDHEAMFADVSSRLLTKLQVSLASYRSPERRPDEVVIAMNDRMRRQ